MKRCNTLNKSSALTKEHPCRDLPDVLALSAETDAAGLRSSLAPVAAGRTSMNLMDAGLNDDRI